MYVGGLGVEMDGCWRAERGMRMLMVRVYGG